MIDVIPGINETEFSEIEKKVAAVGNASEWVHIDVADGVLVPRTTFLDIPKLAPLIAASGRSFEAHLMVAKPEEFIKPLVDAGFKRIIAHIEANDPRLFLDEAKFESVEVGLAIDGPTEFEQIEPFLETVDVVLVMAVEAGESGQKFLPEATEKIKSIHLYLPDLPIEVDGGINEQTALLAKEAGATRLVSTSFVFQDIAHVKDPIERLQQI